jgi:hypothetical protein
MEGRKHRVFNRPAAALLSAIIGAGIDVAYVLLIRSQGAEDGHSREVFLAAFWAILPATALLATFAAAIDRRLAQPVLYAVATGYLASGILALPSIGLGLVIAAILALVAAGKPEVSVLAVVVAVLLPLAGIAVGFATT